MLHVALLTLALVSGECPECGGGSTYYTPNRPGATELPMAAVAVPPRPILSYPSITQMIPCPCVGCVGQNCFSTTRPYLPGVPVYDYRKDFNYPWSQMPCKAVPPPIAIGYDPGAREEVPEFAPPMGPEEVPSPPALDARRKSNSKSRLLVRPAAVYISDRGRVARPPRVVAQP